MTLLRFSSVGTLGSIATLCLLAGCGGAAGGGSSGSRSSSSGGSTDGVSLNLSTHQISVSGDADIASSTPGAVSVTVTATISSSSNEPAAGLYVGASYTRTGITEVASSYNSDGSLAFNVAFIPPAVLGPGTFDDMVTLILCTDSQCVHQLPGTSQTISVQYTVTGSLPGRLSVSPSATQVSVSASAFATSIPNSIVDLTIDRDLGSGGIAATPSFTTNGISGVGSSFQHTDTDIQLNIIFKPPNSLAPGIYNDTITVDVCAEDTCDEELAGSPFTIAVQYTVSNSVAGSNGYSIRLLNLSTNDLAWDASSNRILAATTAGDSTYPNSIVAIDAVGGVVDSNTKLATTPGIEAVSDDDQFLYATVNGNGTIQRFCLPSLAADLTIPLGDAYPGDPATARDIQVVPSEPHSVAVAEDQAATIFDDTTARTAAPGSPYSLDELAFGSTSATLYAGEDGEYGELSVLGVSSSALSTGHVFSTDAQDGFGHMIFAAGTLYTNSGWAIDPSDGHTLRVLQAGAYEGSVAVIPDTVNDRLFAIVASGTSGLALASFDLATFSPIASISLNGLDLSHENPRLIRWGSDGLAFQTSDGRVALINGAFVHAQ